MGVNLAEICQKLVRKKVFSPSDLERSNLDRCLSVVDLVFMGVGGTLGAGMYVVIGQVARDVAGPSVTISFLVAAIASAMAGLCYAEFASRLPRAGSAYVYSYVTVGELMAFVIGWNLILEYVIGTASMARAWSAYFDNMIGNHISKFFQSTMPIQISWLSKYPDFFALFITLLLTGVLVLGVKESARFNNIFTSVNMLVILYILLCGLFKLEIHNWSLTSDEVPSDKGNGGFTPYGISGTMAGAATCFFAFVGFDVVATTGEETKNPQRAMPIAIVVSLMVVFLSYFSVSAVVTMMCPYFLLDPNAALPQVFKRAGWDFAGHLITIGALCGLSSSLLTGMLPLPRILYAMASDGVIFKFMGDIHPKTKTPLVGTAISGVFSGLMATMFDLHELVDMMSIGTLLAYTLVSVSVLILRYECEANLKGSLYASKEDHCKQLKSSRFSLQQLVLHDFTLPTPVTALVSKVAMACLCVFVCLFSWLSIQAYEELGAGEPWAVCIGVLLSFCLACCAVVIFLQPQNTVSLPFKVPFLPWLPIASVMVNIYLMLKLSNATWVRFGVWMAVGFSIYFTYGIRHAETGRSASLDLEERVSKHEESISLPVVQNGEARQTSDISEIQTSSEKDCLMNFEACD